MFRHNCVWIRVNEHYISQHCYRKKPEIYKIFQAVHPVNPSTTIELNDKTRFYKQSRFSYIRPVDGVTRLKVYTCSKITRSEKVIHRSSQVAVEISS